MKRKKPTSLWLLILWLLWTLIAPGCTPFQTYDELEAEAAETGDTTKLDKRDAYAQRAADFFEYKTECLMTNGLVWMCTRAQTTMNRKPRPDDDIDDLIRQYRLESGSGCTCISGARAREVMREMTRRY